MRRRRPQSYAPEDGQKIVRNRTDPKMNKIVIVASGWSFILFTYIDDARSNTNQIKQKSNILYCCKPKCSCVP